MVIQTQLTAAEVEDTAAELDALVEAEPDTELDDALEMLAELEVADEAEALAIGLLVVIALN